MKFETINNKRYSRQQPLKSKQGAVAFLSSFLSLTLDSKTKRSIFIPCQLLAAGRCRQVLNTDKLKIKSNNMNKLIFTIAMLLVIAISCKKKPTSEDVVVLTHAEILSSSVNKITTSPFIGNKVGKVKKQDTLGGTPYVVNISGADTLLFEKYGSTSDSNITLMQKGGQFQMKLCDSNFQDEYLLFSYRSLSKTEILPPNLQYEDHYCSLSGAGPETELIYYYNKDSLVYFRNYSPNLYDTPWNIHPYYNSYLISFTKRQ